MSLVNPTQMRVMIFVDGSNLMYSVKEITDRDRRSRVLPSDKEYRVDFEKLISELQLQNPNNFFIRAYYYGAEDIPLTDGLSPEENAKFEEHLKAQLNFFSFLRSIGFTVRTAKKKKRTNHATGKPMAIEKGVDVCLATELISLAFRNTYDLAIIVSGDRDFLEAVRIVKSLGKIIVIASFPQNTASDLKAEADKYVDLEAVLKKIVSVESAKLISAQPPVR